MSNTFESQQLDAIGFVAALRAKGVTLAVRNNRLWLLPAKAFSELTDAELVAMRRHRGEIKAIVSRGVAVPPVPPVATQPELTVSHEDRSEPKAEVSKPEPPTLPEHIRRIVEWNTPAEQRRRDEEATRVMWKTLGRTSPYL
jgi:hypothetical protein